jgi:polysaccharide pyruvyl transferase CsaB
VTARDPAGCRRRVLLCGYYGEHNLGDDALLQVLLRQLPGDWQPVVTAHDQLQVRRRCAAVDRDIETVDRRSLKAVLSALGSCEALVLGGGSLLQDSTSFRSLLYYGALILTARARRLPVLLWGQGLGPLHRRTSRLLARLLLARVSGISWRDPASAQLAASWGVIADQGSDPVWALPPLNWQGRGGPIVLCWRPVPQLEEGGWRTLLAALEQLAERLDRPVHWLPFHQDQDTGLLAELKRRGLIGERLQRRSHTVAASSPEEAMEHFRTASLVVAMRLHGLILAALAGSPCAALSYDPKVAAAADALGCPWLDLDGLAAIPPPITADKLVARWDPLVDSPPDPGRREQLRADTRVHAALLQRLSHHER